MENTCIHDEIAAVPVIVKRLGRLSYEAVFQEMLEFSASRNRQTPDEIWVVEHEPVFTLGQAADMSHVINAHQLPVIQTDRGGEVTYHGPGQAVIYPLIDLRRRFNDKLLVRELVFRIEAAIIDVLALHNIIGERRAGAPGIYIPHLPEYGINQGAKIAALGLKVKSSGTVYHGLALNVTMDLEPFTWIDPCGYAGQKVTDMKSLGIDCSLEDIQSGLVEALCERLDLKWER